MYINHITDKNILSKLTSSDRLNLQSILTTSGGNEFYTDTHTEEQTRNTILRTSVLLTGALSSETSDPSFSHINPNQTTVKPQDPHPH